MDSPTLRKKLNEYPLAELGDPDFDPEKVSPNYPYDLKYLGEFSLEKGKVDLYLLHEIDSLFDILLLKKNHGDPPQL